jgi:hypothetical protein
MSRKDACSTSCYFRALTFFALFRPQLKSGQMSNSSSSGLKALAGLSSSPASRSAISREQSPDEYARVRSKLTKHAV